MIGSTIVHPLIEYKEEIILLTTIISDGSNIKHSLFLLVHPGVLLPKLKQEIVKLKFFNINHFRNHFATTTILNCVWATFPDNFLLVINNSLFPYFS